jgi:hypothetical protein
MAWMNEVKIEKVSQGPANVNCLLPLRTFGQECGKSNAHIKLKCERVDIVEDKRKPPSPNGVYRRDTYQILVVICCLFMFI